MKIIKNCYGFYGLLKTANEVIWSIGGQLKDLALSKFMADGGLSSKTVRDYLDVSSEFDLKDVPEKLIDERLDEVLSLKNTIFWNSSRDFIEAIVYGKRTAICDDNLSTEFVTENKSLFHNNVELGKPGCNMP